MKNGNQGDGGGRPERNLTDAEIEQVEKLAAMLSQEQIADYFGVAKSTWYAILERQPEVFERYKKGKAKAVTSVAKNLIMQAQAGNVSAAIFYLKTQAGWKETTAHEVTGANGSAIQTVTRIEICAPDDDTQD